MSSALYMFEDVIRKLDKTLESIAILEGIDEKEEDKLRSIRRVLLDESFKLRNLYHSRDIVAAKKIFFSRTK